MKPVRKRLTYANVMSSIAVFLVVAGGTAFAAVELGKESVGTKQLAKEAVSLAKIKKAAKNALKGATGPAGAKGATGPQGPKGDKGDTGPSTGPAGGVLTGSYPNPGLAANAVTGANIQQGTLEHVKAANVYGATVSESGSGSLISSSDSRIKFAGCFIACAVEFPVNVSECTATVSPYNQGGLGSEPAFGEAFTIANPAELSVVMYNKKGEFASHNFGLTVVCPTTS